MPALAQPSRTSPATEVLAGLVERVTFHNEENGFCVLRVKARGQRDLITVLGHAPMISAGEFVQASGAWQNDPTHGVQFRASFLKAVPPTTTEGIEKYLGSGMIRGIGPVYAKKLVRAFADAVFEIIEQDPGRLREVTGIGPKRADRIIAGWAEQKIIREIMLFLHSNGVGTSRAVRIYKTYGADAVQLISENPYRLARDIRGIGFVTADQIATKLGIEKTALIRIRAGISYALAEATDEGHCGLPADELIPLAQKLLEVSPELVETAVGLELQDGTVIADCLDDRRCVFLAGLYHAEREIAGKLRALVGGKPPWASIDADKAIPWVEARTGLALAGSQSRISAGAFFLDRSRHRSPLPTMSAGAGSAKAPCTPHGTFSGLALLRRAAVEMIDRESYRRSGRAAGATPAGAAPGRERRGSAQSGSDRPLLGRDDRAFLRGLPL
jgi:exodeoxyribonuclease V alpha subunit